MTDRTSINDEVDGISAPGMWLTRPFHTGMAANRSSNNRIGLPVAASRKLIAGQANLNHTFRAGRLLHGKSRFDRSKVTLTAGMKELASEQGDSAGIDRPDRRT